MNHESPLKKKSCDSFSPNIDSYSKNQQFLNVNFFKYLFIGQTRNTKVIRSITNVHLLTGSPPSYSPHNGKWVSTRQFHSFGHPFLGISTYQTLPLKSVFCLSHSAIMEVFDHFAGPSHFWSPPAPFSGMWDLCSYYVTPFEF